MFGVFPIGYAAYLSFTSRTGNGAGAGLLSNYTTGDQDFRFLSSAGNVGEYVLIWLPTLIVLVYVAALLLDSRPGRFATAMRVLFYVPGALAGSAAVLVWLFMLDPRVSPFKPVFRLLGLSNVDQVITPPHIAVIIAIIAISTGAGGWIVIVYGALAGIPRDSIEAAKLDGCGQMRLAWNIKLPQIRRYAVLVAIMSFATGTQVFVEPTILYSAGAGFVSPTWSLNELSYVFAFSYGRFGVSAALSIELFLVGLLIAIVVVLKTNFFSTE
jgi:multiple sugar transport system permease protein